MRILKTKTTPIQFIRALLKAGLFFAFGFILYTGWLPGNIHSGLSAKQAAATACTSTTTAGTYNWSNPAAWGSGCNTPATLPGTNSNDSVTMANAAVTINMDVTPTNTLTSLTFAAGNSNTTLGINSGRALSVSGAITINAPGNSNITKQITVGTGTLNAGSISITSGSASNRVSQVTVSTGTINISGNVTFSGTASAARLSATGAATINIGGNLGDGGALSAGSSTIVFNGSGTQTMGAYVTYNNVVASSTSGTVVASSSSVTIGGSLTVASGTFDVSSSALTISGLSTVQSGTTWNNSGNASVALGGLVNNGTFNAGSATTTISGSFTNTGTFNHNNGTVNFTTVSSNTVNTGNSALYNMVMSGSGTLTSQGTTTVANMLNVTAGTFDAGTSTIVLNGTGTPFTVAGTFTASSSTVSYQGTSGTTTPAALAYNNLDFSPASGSPVYTLPGTGGATSGPATLAIDASTPATVKNSGTSQTLTTASFTPPAGSVLYIAIMINSSASADCGGQTSCQNSISSVTDNRGTHLTYTKQLSEGTENGSDTIVYLYTAPVTTSQAMTVSATQTGELSSLAIAMMKVLVVTGASTSSPVGAIGGARGATGVLNDTYTSTAANSWGWLVYGDWTAQAVPTPGSGQTVYDSYTSAGWDTYALIQQNTATAASGTSVIMNTTAPSSGARISHLYFEMKPTITAGGPSANLSINGSLTIGGDGNATVNANINNATTTVAGNLIIGTTGTFVAYGSATTTVGGSFINSGMFTHNNGTVLLNGSNSASILNSGSSSLYNLIINGSGTWTSQGTTTVDSQLNVSSGTLDGGSSTIVLNGTGIPFTVAGTFTASSSTVSYKAASGTTVPAGVSYYNLDFSPASGSPTFTIPSMIPSAPIIKTFAASPATIQSGSSTVLSWAVLGSPAPTISIDNGVGTVLGTSVSVSPSTTTVYTLTATNASGSATAQVTVTIGGTVVYSFDEEFDGSGVDTDAWVIMNRHGDYSNEELQCYLPDNVSVSGGSLNIVTLLQTQVCGDSFHSATSWNYTSGMIQWKTFNFTYGTVEVRAKMGGGQGLWPAIWLLGSNCQASNVNSADNVSPCVWPQSGSDEIDIAEWINGSLLKQNMYSFGNSHDACDLNPSPSPSTNWHTYSMIWTPGSLILKIDGSTTCTYSADVPNQPMFLMLQTALRTPVTDAVLPKTMNVDYVRITPYAADTTAPAAPANMAAALSDSGSPSLSWSAATDNVGVSGYNVYRNGALIATTTSLTYSDGGSLSSNTHYSYSAAAYDAAGNVSVQSAAASIITPPAASDFGHITLDSSTPAAVSGTGALTTAPFTPPANSVIVVGVMSDEQGSSQTFTVSDSLDSHFTYNNIASGPYGNAANDGRAQAWWAAATTSQPMTITVTPAVGGLNNLLRVLVFKGANPNSPIGASGGSRGVTANLSASYTSTVNNSLGWAFYIDKSQSGVPSAGAGESVDSSYDAAGAITAAVIRQSGETAATGTTVTMSTVTPNSGTQITYLYFELVPPSGAELYTSAGSGAWIAPPGVTAVMVETWGGGGGGANRTSSNAGGGGGGGGAYAKANVFSVTPGAVYNFSVGSAGSGGSSPSGGGDSTFGSGSSTIVSANGGRAPAANSATGASGGTVASSTGDTLFAGGSGRTWTSGTNGSGGGGSAGPLSAGNNATTTAGAAAVAGGGPGGNGSSGAGSGSAPASGPGGGGGGAYRATSGTMNGGAGAAGQVKITYILTSTDGALSVGGDLTTSGGGTVDFNTNDTALYVFGSVTVGGNTTIQAPHSTTTIDGNLAINGTYVHNSGTLVLNTAATATVSSATSTAFNNLVIQTPGKTVKFQKQAGGVPVFTVAGTMTVAGSADNNVSIQSDTPGSQWLVHFNGAQNSISYVTVVDSGCDAGSAAATVTNGTSGGNNGACWQGFSGTITINFGGGASPIEGGSGGGSLAGGGGSGGGPSSGGGSSSIVFVQSTSQQCNGTTSCTTNAITTTSGHLVVITATVSGGGSNFITDNKGNSWQAIDGPTTSGTSDTVYIYYSILANGGSGHTFTANVGSSYYAVNVAEYEGIATSSPLDQSNIHTGSGLTQTTASITTTQPNELIVATFNQNSGANSSWTQGANYNLRASIGDASSGGINALEDRVVGSVGAYNATITFGSQTGSWANVIASFKAAPAATGGGSNTPPAEGGSGGGSGQIGGGQGGQGGAAP